MLRAALGGEGTLNQINPWHFRAPIAPLLAARAEKRIVRQVEVLVFARRARSNSEVLLVEGAGGLLSPLGEGFDARDLIVALRAIPVVVCPNRLGTVNQARLVMTALPPGARRRARVVLVAQRRPDNASRTNARLMTEVLGRSRVYELPWLGGRWQFEEALSRLEVRKVLAGLVSDLGSN
jgi:dethiobiotin synthetase